MVWDANRHCVGLCLAVPGLQVAVDPEHRGGRDQRHANHQHHRRRRHRAAVIVAHSAIDQAGRSRAVTRSGCRPRVGDDRDVLRIEGLEPRPHRLAVEAGVGRALRILRPHQIKPQAVALIHFRPIDLQLPAVALRSFRCKMDRLHRLGGDVQRRGQNEPGQARVHPCREQNGRSDVEASEEPFGFLAAYRRSGSWGSGLAARTCAVPIATSRRGLCCCRPRPRCRQPPAQPRTARGRRTAGSALPRTPTARSAAAPRTARVRRPAPRTCCGCQPPRCWPARAGSPADRAVRGTRARSRRTFRRRRTAPCAPSARASSAAGGAAERPRQTDRRGEHRAHHPRRRPRLHLARRRPVRLSLSNLPRHLLALLLLLAVLGCVSCASR